jgi:hypothetical protein
MEEEVGSVTIRFPELAHGRTLGRWIGVFVLVALFQEFAIRLALPKFDPSVQVRFETAAPGQPPLGPKGRTFQQISNTGDYSVPVTFNRHGLRDKRDVSLAAPCDILFVGDSFVFGWGVAENERMSDRLQELLETPVYNMGIPLNLDGYLRLLDHARDLGAKARNVIVAINMSDDIQPYAALAASVPAGTPDEPGPSGSPLARIKGFLTEHSALYFSLTSVVHHVDWLKALAVRAGLIQTVNAAQPQANDRTAVADTVEMLHRVSRRSSVLVLLIPRRLEWQGTAGKPETERRIDFVRAARQAGLDVVDLGERLSETADPLRFYFRNDAHINATGHELAAQALAARARTRFSGCR